MHGAITLNNPAIAEILLREYGANPNTVDDLNRTTLMVWGGISEDRNLSILKLLVKYRFDFAKLINQCDNNQWTVFHYLCINFGNYTEKNIASLKHLFGICEKIPNCSINILARDRMGWCGLHHAIQHGNVDMVKYLLENIYFPNNDKLNKDGVAFMNMRLSDQVSLVMFVMLIFNKHPHDICLEIFKLMVSYGMRVNSKSDQVLGKAVGCHFNKLVEFILNENLCPIETLDAILRLMDQNSEATGISSTEILKALYGYGLKHGVICNKNHDSQIFGRAARYNLKAFKAVMAMILEKHEIKDLKQYKQCNVTNENELEIIAKSPDTNPDVKSFIKALIIDDETKLSEIESATTQVLLRYDINDESKNNDENKLSNVSSSYEKKMADNDRVDNGSFWTCNHCTYHNPINLNTCKICALPKNVCILYRNVIVKTN